LLMAAAVTGETGQQDSALRYAQRAVSADPSEALAWLMLSQRLSANGRGAEARRALSRAQALRSSGARPGRAEGRGHGGGRQ
jgi:predicted Zn-dependent protease